jgi:perosamine synthetase
MERRTTRDGHQEAVVRLHDARASPAVRLRRWPRAATPTGAEAGQPTGGRSRAEEAVGEASHESEDGQDRRREARGRASRERRAGVVPQLRPAPEPAGFWNHYAPLLHLDLPRPRAFCEHLAAVGVPSSTGTFRLVPLDQRPMFADDTRPPCANAAAFLDGILALVLTREDSDERIRHYAETITREVSRWASI